MQGVCGCVGSNEQIDRWGLYSNTGATFKLPPTEGTSPVGPPTEEVCPVGPPTEETCSITPQEVCPLRLQYTVRHELKRALVDGLFRATDRKWLCGVIDQQCDKVRYLGNNVTSHMTRCIVNM